MMLSTWRFPVYPNLCHAQTSIMGDVLFSPGSPTPFDQSSTFLLPIVLAFSEFTGRFQGVVLNEGCFCSLRVFGKVLGIFGCCGGHSCHQWQGLLTTNKALQTEALNTGIFVTESFLDFVEGAATRGYWLSIKLSDSVVSRFPPSLPASRTRAGVCGGV